jgi:hypothetical protein
MAVILLLFVTLNAYADGRNRAVGGVGGDAALMPMKVPGATVTGSVSAVSGNILTVAGLVTIDASQAKITDEHGAAGSVSSIAKGDIVFAVLSSVTPETNGALPAALIGVTRQSDVSLGGPVDKKDSNSLTVLSHQVFVDSNTRFGGGSHNLAELLANDIVQVQADNVDGRLVATSVLSFTPMIVPSTVIHGTVKSIGSASWVISDLKGKDYTILINAQTKIVGTPKVGDDVDVLVNIDSSNQYIAVSIMVSVSMATMHVNGVVKTKSTTSWTIGPRVGMGPDVLVQVTPKTQIIGDPQVGDMVDVAAVATPNGLIAVSITKVK